MMTQINYAGAIETDRIIEIEFFGRTSHVTADSPMNSSDIPQSNVNSVDLTLRIC
jgi:hypothetical protein